MQNGKINNRELRERVVQAVRDAGQPVAVDYIAQLLDLSWVTSRAILMELALAGKLIPLKTTKSWVFSAPGQVVIQTHSFLERNLSR